jgi:hypothetical protein
MSAHRQTLNEPIVVFAPDRPALALLIKAMERLSRPRRVEVVRLGRRARAAKTPRIRRLAREAKAEAKRLVGEGLTR